MKRLSTFLIIYLSAFLLMAQNQQRGKFNPQEFKAKLENYITQEANLTTSEAQAFFPIYFEMKGKQRQLQRQIYRIKNNAPADNANDKDFSIAIQNKILKHFRISKHPI